MEEIWKDIPRYEGIYQASSLGRIRTCDGKTTYTARHGIRHWKQRILSQKWCRNSKVKQRYDARVELWKNGKHKTYLVARLVASAFYGESNLTVNHIDGNSQNNAIENLEFVSISENIKKGFEINLFPQKQVVITNKQTREMTNFVSLASASRHIHKCNGYLSCMIKRHIFENKEYRWELR